MKTAHEDRERLARLAGPAGEAAQRFVDWFFRNHGRPGPRVSIPARPDYDDDLVLTTVVRSVPALLSDLAEVERERDLAIQLLAEWCEAIDRNGTGWDDWDEHYKQAAYRPGPLRDLIDAAIKKARGELGGA